MVEGTQAQAAGRSIRELERLRDDYLVAIQQVLRQYDIGAGSTLRMLEERLYKDAAAAAGSGAGSGEKDGETPKGGAAPLPRFATVVRPEWADYNDHMTDFRYGHVFGDAMGVLYHRAGIDAAFRKNSKHMFYTVESHVKHLGEAKVGEPLYVTTQVLSVDDKRLHVFHRLHRDSDHALIATGEQMHLFVDTAASKAASMDAALRGKLEALRLSHAHLPMPHEAGKPVGSRTGR
jgi:carnitine 3-dehydrogenase